MFVVTDPASIIAFLSCKSTARGVIRSYFRSLKDKDWNRAFFIEHLAFNVYRCTTTTQERTLAVVYDSEYRPSKHYTKRKSR